MHYCNPIDADSLKTAAVMKLRAHPSITDFQLELIKPMLDKAIQQSNDRGYSGFSSDHAKVIENGFLVEACGGTNLRVTRYEPLIQINLE